MPSTRLPTSSRARVSGPGENSWPTCRIATKADAHSTTVTPAAARASQVWRSVTVGRGCSVAVTRPTVRRERFGRRPNYRPTQSGSGTKVVGAVGPHDPVHAGRAGVGVLTSQMVDRVGGGRVTAPSQLRRLRSSPLRFSTTWSSGRPAGFLVDAVPTAAATAAAAAATSTAAALGAQRSWRCRKASHGLPKASSTARPSRKSAGSMTSATAAMSRAASIAEPPRSSPRTLRTDPTPGPLALTIFLRAGQVNARNPDSRHGL